MPKTTMTTVRARINALRDSGKKWREIGEEYPGVNLGTLCRIAHDKTYEPKNHLIRHALGLDPLPVEVLPCLKCGKLHDFKRKCPDAFIKYAPHPVMRLSRLRAILTSPYKDS